MPTLKENLFIQFAQRGLVELTNEFRTQYQSKRGDRFSVHEITYEIGTPTISKGRIKFEISSKIPQDELTKSMPLSKYFDAVKSEMKKADKKPSSIDMENIVRETRDDERKERDYVKLTYSYSEKELFSEKEIQREAVVLGKDPGSREVPIIPSVPTLAGRLVLLSIQKRIRETARQNVEMLIQANGKVRKRKGSK
jgi:hypothetical protein